MTFTLQQFAGQYVDDVPATTSPSAAQSIAQFTREYGGSLERIGTTDKFLMLLSILDYIGTGDPVNHPMQAAVTFQDGDGYLSGDISQEDWALSDWLSHFAQLAEEAESKELLWGIAATLFEQLRQGC